LCYDSKPYNFQFSFCIFGQGSVAAALNVLGVMLKDADQTSRLLDGVVLNIAFSVWKFLHGVPLWRGKGKPMSIKDSWHLIFFDSSVSCLDTARNHVRSDCRFSGNVTLTAWSGKFAIVISCLAICTCTYSWIEKTDTEKDWVFDSFMQYKPRKCTAGTVSTDRKLHIAAPAHLAKKLHRTLQVGLERYRYQVSSIDDTYWYRAVSSIGLSSNDSCIQM